MSSAFLLASAMLAGTIMGAGIFSLPFVVRAVGTGLGFLYLALFAGVYCAIHLMFAHVVRDEHGAHDLPHLAGEYLGRAAEHVASFSVLAELLLVLTAYLTLAPSFFPIFSDNGHGWLLAAFWAVSSLFIFADLRTLGIADLLGVSILAGVVGMVFFFGLGHMNAAPWSVSLSGFSFLLPFGPLLFAMSGRPALFKLVQEWKAARAAGRPFSLSGAVVTGTVFSVLVYALFIVGVLRLNASPSSETIVGLADALPHAAYYALGVMGIVAIWKSYFMIGANVRDILRNDMRVANVGSALVVLLVPPLLYIFGAREFLSVIGFAGGVFLALEGIFIVAIWRKHYRTHPLRPASLLLYGVFFLAICYELVHILL